MRRQNSPLLQEFEFLMLFWRLLENKIFFENNQIKETFNKKRYKIVLIFSFYDDENCCQQYVFCYFYRFYLFSSFSFRSDHSRLSKNHCNMQKKYFYFLIWSEISVLLAQQPAILVSDLSFVTIFDINNLFFLSLHEHLFFVYTL